jgi:uncharacterized protein (TIGR04255 family)
MVFPESPRVLYEKKELADRIEGAVRQVVIGMDERSKVRIQHGTVLADAATGDVAYMIDADYFTEQSKEAKGATEVLDRFNRESGRLFRWYITDRLHRAMEPRELAEHSR